MAINHSSDAENFGISRAQQEVLKELNTLYTDCDCGIGQVIFNEISEPRKKEHLQNRA